MRVYISVYFEKQLVAARQKNKTNISGEKHSGCGLKPYSPLFKLNGQSIK
jgi:hypothetical protein